MQNARRRETRQRNAVLTVLREVPGFRSAQQLHALLRERGDGVGLATVYRTLQHLTQNGEVDILRTNDGEAIYRLCGTGHHHHLVCRRCRRAVEIDNEAVERWAQRLAEDNRFTDVEHTVEMIGTCADCAEDTGAGGDGTGADHTGGDNEVTGATR